MRIWIDAHPDLELQGEVKKVSKLPEPKTWRKSEIKFYPAVIKIDGQPEDLWPGMSAKVEIIVRELEDVLAVPVQTIVHSGEDSYCWVMNGDHPEPRRVRLGKSNDQYVQVKEGLAPNDQVVQNPNDLPMSIPESGEPVGGGLQTAAR